MVTMEITGETFRSEHKFVGELEMRWEEIAMLKGDIASISVKLR